MCIRDRIPGGLSFKPIDSPVGTFQEASSPVNAAKRYDSGMNIPLPENLISFQMYSLRQVPATPKKIGGFGTQLPDSGGLRRSSLLLINSSTDLKDFYCKEEDKDSDDIPDENTTAKIGRKPIEGGDMDFVLEKGISMTKHSFGDDDPMILPRDNMIRLPSFSKKFFNK
eukprot:TRINITY_DN3601_c0_g6_i1.p1 TRINITY_DN3601_c0_g6~~TRINITY_DN3601_c0_g6_i1.p1  ORF type:complete len:189 (+),score=42.33 TRINITY_DN3601_c0_g6_i1:63-569(+)